MMQLIFCFAFYFVRLVALFKVTSLAWFSSFSFNSIFICFTNPFQVTHQLKWSLNHKTVSQSDFNARCNSVLPFNFAFRSSNIEKCLVFHIIFNEYHAFNSWQFHIASLLPCLFSFFDRVYIFVQTSLSQVIVTNSTLRIAQSFCY